jgi:prolyl 4-hydroxylase
VAQLLSIAQLLLLVVGGAMASDVFTSLAELPKVLHAEHTLATELRQYVEVEQMSLDRLKRLADDFEVHSAQALADPEKHLGNPVSAYLLIKRFASDWNTIIEKDIRTNATEEFLLNVSSKTNVFPDQQDLDGAAIALLRLQDTYALTTAKLANGDLQGVQNSPRMTAEDCFQLGSVAYNKQDYYHTILWMEEALRTEEEESVKTVDRSTLLDYLSYSVYMQGNVRRALNLTIDWLKIEPDHIRAHNNKQYFEKAILEQETLHGPQSQAEQERVVNERPRDNYQSSTFFKNYERLCRGEQTHNHTFEHKLTCQYRRHHPYLYIRPALEEVVHLKPLMLMYHGILSETEVNRIKEMAFPRLYRSVVYHANGQSDTSAQDYRISKSAWLKDVEDDVITGISKKASFVANLTLDTAEDLQVLNYGIGGHYEPHYDFAQGRELNTFEKGMGNRIATFICYASDVIAGGATVFPDIGVKLFPEKGSCVLWYNLKKSGEGDLNTRHAACPVLTGFKWVANKWFHERGQERIRPCATDEMEYE